MKGWIEKQHYMYICTTSCPGLNVVAAQDISEIVLRDLQFLPLDLAS